MKQIDIPVKPLGPQVVEGCSVWSWPEFRALLQHWPSMAYNAATVEGFEIHLPCQEAASLSIKHRGEEPLVFYPSGNDYSSGYGVYHTPEFIALAQRLGIPLEQRVISITLRFFEGQVPRWTAEVACCDLRPEPEEPPLVQDSANPFYPGGQP